MFHNKKPEDYIIATEKQQVQEILKMNAANVELKNYLG